MTNENTKWDLVKVLVDSPELQAHFDENGKLETHCNFFVQKVAHLWGCYDLDGKTANTIIAYLDGAPDWEEITPTLAQEKANAGSLVIACSSNPGGHGHLCPVVPGVCEWSSTLKLNVPQVANVGPKELTFYGKKASFAFGKSCITKPRTLNFYVFKGALK